MHSAFRGLLVAALLPSVALAQSCGNCDAAGGIDVLDALRAAQMAAAILPVAPGDLDVCDVDSTGGIDVLDSLRIAQAAAQLNPVLVCPATPNTPPAVLSATVPAGTLSGTVLVTYLLADAESHPCSLNVEFSTSGGGNFAPATSGAGGDGSNGLTSSPGGTSHLFAWDTTVDLGPGTFAPVVLRLTPSDVLVGVARTTAPFTVDNPLPPVSYSADVHPLYASLGCTGCHPPPGSPDLHGTPQQTYSEVIGCCVNVGNPPSSSLLRMPLAPSAGGSSHPGGTFFQTTQDPNYQTILRWIQEGAQNN